MVLRLVGETVRWIAYCDDDLPIEVRDGGGGAPIELTWEDGSVTTARLGPLMPNMAAEAAEAGGVWPPTRRFVIGSGPPPPALTLER